ncbi:response regulator transcription factor [Carnobacterium gallinarum]|uniref:response regulator transcription factor n=1 Tax=Carnobacterium gallinarum TaxID=2749 RepID=UPI000557A9A8|nr:response regulator transcription factor [Carnobacterium gallinarum]
MNLLIVEDEKLIADSLALALTQAGYVVTIASSIQQANLLLNQHNFSLILLDLGLPDGDGFDLGTTIKKNYPVSKLIFLTAVDEEERLVAGLELGEDYITKPFRLRELLVRIKNVLATETQPLIQPSIIIGELELSLTQPIVKRYTQEINLSPLEYRLLQYLMEHPNRTLTREQILASIWDHSGNFVNDNTLTVTMKRLRQKIENKPQQPQRLKTIRGLGYFFDSKGEHTI